MKVISIASRKGGAGKSTLAAHLGVLAAGEGASVVLCDTDPQRSLTWWWKLRPDGVPMLVEGKAGELPDLIKAARREGVGWMIIDTPPHAEVEIVAAVRASDLTLIPCRPGPFDLAAVGATLDLVSALRKPTLAVLTACPSAPGPGEAAIVREARTVLNDMGAKVAEVSVGNRAALSHALVGGQAVNEFEPNSKAARELAALWDEVKRRVA